MDHFRIVGPCRLVGRIRISGAKNAALPAMAAVLLTEDEVQLQNMPAVWDVETMGRILDIIGYDVAREGDVARFRQRRVQDLCAPYDLVRTMRASILCLGPLVSRFGYAKVSLPGGCAIGARPVNLHLAGLERMGAEIEVEHGYIIARCRRLCGADYTFEKVTVTGTENLMMAAALADGRTTLHNSAVEPEVTDLGEMLRCMGARIEGLGTRQLVIDGVKSLHGCCHPIIPDRITTGTYLVAGAITRGELVIENCRPSHLQAVLDILAAAGVRMEVMEDRITLTGNGPLRPVTFTTSPYPGFPTDMQAQLMSLMTQADGTSCIRESIFENRFLHAMELDRMGAKIRIDGNTALVYGPRPLQGATVTASDLRASASLVLAALAAKGETIVRRIYHLDRGYERMEEKLNALGATIERIRA
ncbi:MAG: UDP-N-acetylglucosamine 1-carboxyvinyltransferase [Acidobacteria bacterium]|nr:UDP-N-acetylglucosamine 1-carboxyvinyltransferase [Acidobacteriota bacterium]